MAMVDGKTVQMIGRDPSGLELLVIGEGKVLCADSRSELFMRTAGSSAFELVPALYKSMLGGAQFGPEFQGLRVKQQGPYMDHLLCRYVNFKDGWGNDVWSFGPQNQPEVVLLYGPGQFAFTKRSDGSIEVR